MKHKMWYNDEHDIVFLEFTDHFLRNDVDPIFQRVEELLKGKPYRQVLVIMSSTHNVENRETREATNQALNNTDVSHVAFVGGSSANRMIARVLIKTGIIKTNGDFFKTVDEGIKWLKSKR
jgi:hypothetical protein